MEWYYVENNESVGPVQESDLRALSQQGKITAQTMVCRQGDTAWVPFAQAFAASSGAVAVADPTGAPQVSHSCVMCQKSVTADDAVQLSGNWVCAACKPLYLQKLKEGATISGVRRYAGFWIRVGAKIIDSLILMMVTIPFQFIATALIPGANDPKAIGSVIALAVVTNGFNILSNLAYQVFFLGKYAATPGKMVCKIKVIRSNGAPVTYGRATGRYFAEILSGLTLGIGYLMVAFDEEKRGLHDRICDTRVIYKD